MPWGLIILLGSGLVVGWLLLVSYTAWILTHPARRTYAFAVARGLPGDPSEVTLVDRPGRGLEYTEWKLRSRGRELPVWDITGLDDRGPAIIITHGWGDSRVVMLSRLAGLAPIASRLILWDLPGHGDAPRGGFTLGAREHEDLLALIEAVGTQRPLVLYGASLGAGAGIVAAGYRHAPRGGTPALSIIAEAPYRVPLVPARNVFRGRGMPFRTNLRPAMAILGSRFAGTLSWTLAAGAGGFDRALHAARLPASIPLLVLHGSLDPVCPVEDGRAIAAAAPHSRLVILEGGGHNNLWTEPDLAAPAGAAVRDFLGTLEAPAPQPEPEPTAGKNPA